MLECPLTKSTSTSSFGNGMDIEINQKTKYKENTFYALHNVWQPTMEIYYNILYVASEISK